VKYKVVKKIFWCLQDECLALHKDIIHIDIYKNRDLMPIYYDAMLNMDSKTLIYDTDNKSCRVNELVTLGYLEFYNEQT